MLPGQLSLLPSLLGRCLTVNHLAKHHGSSCEATLVSWMSGWFFIRIGSSQESPIFGEPRFERNLWHESIAREDKTPATQAARRARQGSTWTLDGCYKAKI